MKTTKLYTCLLLLAAWTCNITEAKAQEAEFVKLNKAYTLHEDGSREFRCYKELQIFTHTAMNSTYGETFIIYNPDFQELEIHTAYTKQKDGTIIKTPENAFVEVLPRFAVNAPAFNRLKEMVVVHTGLDLGATIYLDYSIRTKAGFLPALEVDEIIQETSPVSEYRISITLPAGQTLNRVLYASGVNAVESVSDGMKTYTWTFKNIPPSSRMPFLPQNKENIPRLVADTYAKSNDAFRHIAEAANGARSMESETYAQFITEDCASDKEKADIIHKHVVKNISTTPIPQQYSGTQLRNADEVLRGAYGTELEKANLLRKMLNAVDIPSEIVFIFPATIQPLTGGLASVKSVCVRAMPDGEETFLPATGISPLKPELRGTPDRLFTLNGEMLDIKASPAIYNEDKEITLELNQFENGYLVYTLPPGKGIDTWHMASLNSKRSDPFELPSALQEKTKYIITLPEGVTLATSVEPVQINTPFGQMSRTITANDNRIEVVSSIELNKQLFTADEYPAVRKLITEWNNPKNKQLLFKTM